MPKMKTRKGVAKRIRVTSTGKLMRRRMIPKGKKGHRDLHEYNVSPADAGQVRQALGI